VFNPLSAFGFAQRVDRSCPGVVIMANASIGFRMKKAREAGIAPR
jgi:hypothetical protein